MAKSSREKLERDREKRRLKRERERREEEERERIERLFWPGVINWQDPEILERRRQERA